jgi:two-component system cell cycle sensor histidine kinase PleC
VRAAHDASGLGVAVIDTGIGIAPEMIPVALEPFRQISSPMARNAGGSGLGLSLVKSLTEQHGGVFRLESALGKGTVASLHFPSHLLKWTRMSA